jgi:hypothetical protein
MEHIQLEYSLSQYFTAYTKSNCEHFEIWFACTCFKLILIEVNSNWFCNHQFWNFQHKIWPTWLLKRTDNPLSHPVDMFRWMVQV